jgi:hypothetical protein
MSIDWSKQPFWEHSKLMSDILKQVEKEWRSLPWWKRLWIAITKKSRKWKKQRLIEHYKTITEIEKWGEEILSLIPFPEPNN